jgi:hypothetical protein
MSEVPFKIKLKKVSLDRLKLPSLIDKRGVRSRPLMHKPKPPLYKAQRSGSTKPSKVIPAESRNPLGDISNKTRESVFHRVQGAMLRAAAKRHAIEHTISFDLATVDSCDEGSPSPKKL